MRARAILKLLDRLTGPLLISLLGHMFRQQETAVQSILIFRPGGIGDAVLLAPAINLLKRHYPASTISVLAEQRNAGVFALVPAVGRLYCYDRPSDFWQAVRGKYDLVIDTEQWHRLSAVVARFVRAPMKIGFATNERSRMFTHTISYAQDEYEVESFSRLLSPLGIHRLEYAAPFLTVPDEANAVAASLLAPLGERPFIAIFSGASIPERRWGAGRFLQVAEDLIRRGYGVVVVGGVGDYQDGKVISRAGGLNLAGLTSLVETAAVLKCSQLVISGDSGVLHLAVGLGIPTVSLFGPGRALKWSPRGDSHTVLNKRLSCSPCTTFGTTPPCPYGARCLKEIEVHEVICAVEHLLTHGACLGCASWYPGLAAGGDQERGSEVT